MLCPEHLLGHVEGSAHCGHVQDFLVSVCLGETEISNFEHALADEDVGWLQIPK